MTRPAIHMTPDEIRQKEFYTRELFEKMASGWISNIDSRCTGLIEWLQSLGCHVADPQGSEIYPADRMKRDGILGVYSFRGHKPPNTLPK